MSATLAITYESRNGATVRRFLFISLSLFIIFLFMGLVSMTSAYASTDVGGSINQNTEWKVEGSPYLVSGSISVEQGAALTIDSGVIVKFDRNSYLTINAGGFLNATNVIFTSYKDDINGGDTDGGAYVPAPGDWGYIGFTGGGIIDNCMILYGGGLYGAAGNASIYVNGDSPTIANSIVTKSKRSGIWINAGTPSVISNDITDNEGQYGIYAPSIYPLALRDNRITDNANATAIFLPAALGQGIS